MVRVLVCSVIWKLQMQHIHLFSKCSCDTLDRLKYCVLLIVLIRLLIFKVPEYTEQYAFLLRFSSILQFYMFLTLKAACFGMLWAFCMVF